MRPGSALLQAVRDDVRGLLQDKGKLCDIRPDGQPPSSCGEVFYAVHAAGFRADASEAEVTHLERVYDVEVTITRRSSFAPNDRLGIAIIADSQRTGTSGGTEPSLMDRADELAVYLHGRAATLSLAETKLERTPGNLGFAEPLRFRNCSRPEERGPSWFFCTNENRPSSGYSVTLTFGGARHGQDLR